MALDVSHITPVMGSIVRGLNLPGDINDALMRELVDLLFERGVVVIPGQSLEPQDYVRFARYFGRPLEFFIPKDRDPIHPEIIHINNDAATPPHGREGAAHWHSDSTYETVPGAVTMLLGMETPDQGGETRFASTAAAYASLPEETKRRIDGLVARHELGRAPWIEGESPPHPDRPVRKTDAPDHPLVMVHPVTGRKAIFTSGTAYAIHGMDDAEATDLIRELRRHIVRPEHRMSYTARTGDLVLWDNFGTVHSATPIEYSNEPGKRRVLHRISTKGVPVFYEAA